MSKRGVITVVSGFSGAGKGTIVRKLVDQYGYVVSVSATTREPREGEVDGVHYFFKTNAEFEEMIQQGKLMEHAGYVDHYYGTPKEYVMQHLEKGIDVILEIEMQGALQIKQNFPEAVLVFLTPPSYEELKNRLMGRGTETEEVIAKRLQRASEECEYLQKYDYIVVNEEVDVCAEQVHQLIQSVHLRRDHQQELMNRIITEFSEQGGS